MDQDEPLIRRLVPACDPADAIAGLWEELRKQPLSTELWLELTRLYNVADQPAQWHYTAQQLRRLQHDQERSLGATPPGCSAENNQADSWEVLLRAPGSKAARIWASRLQHWLMQCPGDWLGWLYLARLEDANNEQIHHQSLEQACRHEPIAGESLHWLGVWRLEAGDHRGAIEALAPLVDRHPMRHGSMLHLGEALLRVGNRTAAEAAFTRASASRNPAFLRLLAQRVHQHNYWQEAIAVLERARHLAPDAIPTLIQLARLHWDVYQLNQAEVLCQRILELEPGNRDVRYLLNALPGRRGDAAAHLAAVEAHYNELGHADSRLASSIAMASLYVDDCSPTQIAERHCQLCQPIETAISPQTAFSNERDPERPLKIGLVSGDFHRQHPVNLFMLPLLERLDRNYYPVTVFHTGSMHDEYTLRARQATRHWIEATGQDDPSLSQCIREQGIDILIDLAGHTSSHRLGVFAMRSAPVQATFLGYPHSTGLSRIDWLIGDPVVSPVEHAHLFSEGIAQLPASVFCWSPVDDYPLPPARPAEAPLIFGSFNNVMKLSPRTISLWSALLRDLPEARLLLKAPSLSEPSVVERFTGLFTTHGISADRLRFEGPQELSQMMQRYGAIDIALDPTPYNGGTTSLQALWMGVPLITLQGGNFVSRMGTSFLTTLGRPEWIARDEGDYRRIARELAAQREDLRANRASLRLQMATSGLSDLERYASNVQALWRRMWQHHCSKQRERILAAQA